MRRQTTVEAARRFAAGPAALLLLAAMFVVLRLAGDAHGIAHIERLAHVGMAQAGGDVPDEDGHSCVRFDALAGAASPPATALDFMPPPAVTDDVVPAGEAPALRSSWRYAPARAPPTAA